MPDIDIEDDHEREAAQAASDVAVSVHADGDVNIEIESGDEDEDDLMVDQALSEAFAKLVKSDFVPDTKLSDRIDKLRKQVKNLNSVVSIVKESRLSGDQQERLEMCFMSLVREAVSLQTELKRGGRGSQRLEQKLNSTIKEMREMSSKYKRNIFDFLFEAEENVEEMKHMREQDEMEAEEEAEVEVEEEVEEEADVDVDVDAAQDALMDLGDALGLDLEVAEEGGEEEEEEEEEELELDLEEMDDMGEAVYEIEESVLRKELNRMRRARRIRESAEEEADQFGGGEVLGDVIEVDEETLINVLADELGSVSESRRRRRRPARRPAGNRAARRAMREAAEYKKAARNMKQQLVEMNLFNAKLLYANKLLQNKNLTVKQQRAIVEALDNAKTLREAKLLYKSLSGSLARRGQSGKLSESVNRTLGSSSRSTRSGQPSKSGVETDRWAVLAGIGKN